MTGPTQTVRSLWSALIGHQEPSRPEVTIHNPAALRAHDLDDPFFDENIQIRVAETIAATGNKKTKNSH
jgi:hypothetical protein